MLVIQFFGQISVCFVAFFRECTHPKTPHFILGPTRVVAVSSDFGLHFPGRWYRSRRLGLERLKSRSRLLTSCAKDNIFDQIMHATLIKRAKSGVAIYGMVPLK